MPRLHARSRPVGYPSHVSDEEWALVVPYLTLNREDSAHRQHDLRAVFNAVRYLVRTGARDEFFSPRRSNANARSLLLSVAEPNIERLYTAPRKTDVAAAVAPGGRMAKAHLPIKRTRRAG